MNAFAVAWLDLRENADLTARDRQLAASAVTWLQFVDEPLIVDLGAGTGSTLRALTACGLDHAVWRLVDHDGTLLDIAIRRHGRLCRIEDYQADLSLVEELPLEGARLVTASALFDLVSAEVAEQLVRRLARQHTALYAALSYDGSTHWSPPHPLDAAVLVAFNNDQCRDKGLGPALGAAAGVHLQGLLERAGFTVVCAPSPWRLGPADQALVCELVRGIAAAVRTGYGLDEAALNDWEAFRLQHADAGTCTVGHVDLLALPGEDRKRA